MSVEGVGMTTAKLDGFREVFERGTIDVEIGTETYRSCSIPGVVILKMIAYDDRPDSREKDVEDIAAICQHYPTIEEDNIWGNHSDLYNDELEQSRMNFMPLFSERKSSNQLKS